MRHLCAVINLTLLVFLQTLDGATYRISYPTTRYPCGQAGGKPCPTPGGNTVARPRQGVNRWYKIKKQYRFGQTKVVKFVRCASHVISITCRKRVIGGKHTGLTKEEVFSKSGTTQTEDPRTSPSPVAPSDAATLLGTDPPVPPATTPAPAPPVTGDTAPPPTEPADPPAPPPSSVTTPVATEATTTATTTTTTKTTPAPTTAAPTTAAPTTEAPTTAAPTTVESAAATTLSPAALPSTTTVASSEITTSKAKWFTRPSWFIKTTTKAP